MLSRSLTCRAASCSRWGGHSYRPRRWLTTSSLVDDNTHAAKWASLRKASAETGENQTGHIRAAHNEGILFFDNLSPLFLVRFNRLLSAPWSSRNSLADVLQRYQDSALSAFDPLNLVKRAIPQDAPMEIVEILPRRKDAACFVKFAFPENCTAKDIEDRITQHLHDNPVRPWHNPLSSIGARLVLGKPWLEDLNRSPRHTLKVEFVPTSPERNAAELSQETLYELFRRYGKLIDIASQPPDSKAVPRYAHIKFSHPRAAIIAQNCMHGFQAGEDLGGGRDGTILRLSFEQKNRGRWFWDWLVNHPRVSIPILAALLATLTVAIFDPIRTFFIKAHIDQAFRITNNKVYKWFKSQATDILTFRRRKSEDPSLDAIWQDRKKALAEMSSWLIDPADTFIVIQGPRGSGKRELIMDFALKDREDILYIDCKPIQEARGDSATIGAAAKAVGYRPVFSWMNSLSSWIDLAAQGTIGVKSGFSETLDSQLAKIWQNTAIALKQVALSHRKSSDADAKLTADDWLEAHPELRPVVVIDNFLHKNDESSLVYDKISEWAARLTSSNIAHVIFLTTDTSFSKPLGKALPDRVFRTVPLGDLSFENARRFVMTHLKNNGDTSPDPVKSVVAETSNISEFDESINLLGGRLTDLEFFARRLKSGQSPAQAVAEITEQNANEVTKIYLLSVPAAERKWSAEQAWYLISALADGEEVNYNEALLSPTFASSQSTNVGAVTAIETLASTELISLNTCKGRPQSIRPGKPIYQAAFRALVADSVLRSRFQMAVVKELLTIEVKSLAKVEDELNLLGQLPKQTNEVGARVVHLLKSLQASQTKIEAWEKEVAVLKKGMLEEAV